MILYGYPLPPCRRTHSAAEQVVRRALFAPSPCSRGVASETRGCGGLVPRKAFSFGNFGQRQAKQRRARRKTAERQAKQRRARRKTAERQAQHRPVGRKTAERQAKQRRARRKTAERRAKQRPVGRKTAERRAKHRRARRKPGQRQAKHRRASVTSTKAGGGRPERFVKAGFCLYESFWIPLAALPKNTLCRRAGGKARVFCAVPLLPRRRK